MRPLSKPLRWTLRALAASYLLYLLAGNVFINTALGERVVNQRPAGFRMQWSWGVTPWPGWVYLRHPALAGHARWKQWSVTGRGAYGRIALLPLLQRRLSFDGVHADAVRVRVVRADHERRPPPWSPQAWTVSLRGLRTDSLRHVRWFALSFDGRASADVGFSHQLRGGPTQVFPSSLHVTEGRLAYRDQPLLTAMTLDMRGTVAPFRHDQPAGLQKFDLLQATLQLDATTPALSPPQPGDPMHWLGGDDPDAHGRLHAAVSFDRGRLGEGGVLRWDGPLAIGTPAHRVHVVPAQMLVQAHADELQLRARAVSSPGDDERRAQLELRYAGRHLRRLASADAWSHLDGSLQLHWHFASLDWLGPLLAKDWLRLQGAGELDADVRLSQGVLQPGSHAELPGVDLRARVFDNEFAGHASAKARVEGQGEHPVTLSIAADRYTLAAAAQPDAVYLHGNDLAIDLHSSAALSRFAAQARGRLHFRDARIPDLRTYNRYLPGESVRILGGHGRSSADLVLGGGGVVTAGQLHLDGQGLDVALGVARLHTDLNMDASLDHAQQTAPRRYALSSFGVALSHVRLDDADDRAWWAKATLQHGVLDWNEPFRLRGDAKLRMKDASVLLALFAKRHAFPAWIARIVDVGELDATGQLLVGKRKDDRAQFVLDDVRAHNRRADLDARLRILDGKPDGVLYARWGVLGLGVALGQGQRDFHLVGASKWYEAQPPLLEGTPPQSP